MKTRHMWLKTATTASTIGLLVAVSMTAEAATLFSSSPQAQQKQFKCTNSTPQPFTVPEVGQQLTKLTISAIGAQGGSYSSGQGGFGAKLTATVYAQAGQQFEVIAGCSGYRGPFSGYGFGAGGQPGSSQAGYGGGASSVIWKETPLITAGGGGGAGADGTNGSGGNGGTAGGNEGRGQAGQNGDGPDAGKGGAPSAPGTNTMNGANASKVTSAGGGGGGGGYAPGTSGDTYGGGSAGTASTSSTASSTPSASPSGGGGGASGDSYLNASQGVQGNISAGDQPGNGSITISWTPSPSTQPTPSNS